MRQLKKKIKFTVEKTGSGFSAYSNDYPIYSTGRSMPDLINNCNEASSLYFEGSGYEVSPANIRLELDFSQFFQHYKILNARVLAKRIGINATLLSQYVHGIKKPSAKQSEKIIAGIHQIGKELSEISLVNH